LVSSFPFIQVFFLYWNTIFDLRYFQLPHFFQEQLGRKAVRNVLFSNSLTRLQLKTEKYFIERRYQLRGLHSVCDKGTKYEFEKFE